jgi:hypothetical protein
MRRCTVLRKGVHKGRPPFQEAGEAAPEGAHSTGRPCQSPAVSGRSRCRMRGGARGSGGPRGERNGNFRHGYFTAENVAERKAVREVVRQTRRILGSVR